MSWNTSIVSEAVSDEAADAADGGYGILPISIGTGQTVTYNFGSTQLTSGTSTVERALTQYLDYGSVVSGNYLLRLNLTSSYSVSGSAFSCYADWRIIINGVEYSPFASGSNLGAFYIYLEDVNFQVIGVKCILHLLPNKPSGATYTDYSIVSVTGTISYFQLTPYNPSTPGINVTDEKGNQLLEEQNRLQQEGNKLQEESNDLQKEANETSKGILGKITDFFAGFFDGIINAFISLFVPDDDFFSDYFARLNDFFSQKLGFLYVPVELLVEVIEGISNASSSPPGIEFPGIEWDGQYIIEPQVFNFSTIFGEMPGLQDAIYLGTDVIMIGALLLLLQNKLKEVLEK